MTKQLPIYKIKLVNEDSIEIAIVEDPAIEVDFLKFNSEETKLEFNEDKMIVKGAVMIPDQLIYRNDKLGERFVTYDINEIQNAARLFLKNGMKFNKDHSSIYTQLDVLESYIANEQNEFNVPLGSWIISAKVRDDKLWNEIKNGTFNGFSMQGLFTNELIGVKELQFNKEKEMDFKEKLQTVIDAVFFANEKEIKEDTPKIEEVEEKVEVLTPEMFTKEETESLIVEAIKTVTEKFNSQFEELVKQLKEANAKVEEFSKQPLSAPVQEEVDQPIEKSGNPALRYF